jgi:hypothetical protein
MDGPLTSQQMTQQSECPEGFEIKVRLDGEGKAPALGDRGFKDGRRGWGVGNAFHSVTLTAASPDGALAALHDPPAAFQRKR